MLDTKRKVLRESSAWVFTLPIFTGTGLVALRGVARRCSALHSSGWVLGPDALGFPPGLQQNGLKLLQRGCDSLASFFAPTLGFFPNSNTITRN